MVDLAPKPIPAEGTGLMDPGLKFIMSNTLFKNETEKKEAIASIIKMVETMPESTPEQKTAKTGLLGELKEPDAAAKFFVKNTSVKGMGGFGALLGGDFINPDKLKQVSDALLASMGGSYIKSDATTKIIIKDAKGEEKPVIVVGGVNKEGLFVPTGYVAMSDALAAVGGNKNPTGFFTLIPEDKRKPIKTTEDLQGLGFGVSAPASATAPVTPAVKPVVEPMDKAAKEKAVDNMLGGITVPKDDKAAQDKVVARLKRLASAMPEGDRKKALEAAIKPDIFKDGKLTDSFRKTFSENFADAAVKVKTAKGEMIAFGTFTAGEPKGKFRLIAEMPADAGGKADTLDKIKLPKNPADTKLQIDAKMPASGAPEFEDPAAIVLGSDLDEIEESFDTLDSATPGAPPPQPKVGGTKVIGSKKGFMEKLMNPGAGIGAIIGGILGFMGLGPLGAVIGVLLGGLGGSMLTGNSPFEDKADMVITPADSRIQVRTPEGDAPTLNMKMDGPPGYDLLITGKTNEAGQFEMTQSVLNPKAKGGQALRLRFNPPKTIPTTADGFINKDELYTSVLGPDAQKILAGTAPPPEAGTGPDVEKAGDKKDAEVSLENSKVKPEMADKKYVVKGADGKVMGVVKGVVSGDRFIVTEFGDGKNASDPRKTTPVAPLEVALEGGKIDFKKVMTELRSRPAVAPLKLEVTTVADPVINTRILGPDRKELPGKMVKISADVGDPKQSFVIDGMLSDDGKKLTVKQISRFSGSGADATAKLMVLGGGEFTVDMEKDTAKMAKQLMDSPKMQRAFVDFSSAPGNTTVATLDTVPRDGDPVSPLRGPGRAPRAGATLTA